MSKVKTAVLVSGGGTNLQAIIDATKSGIITSAALSLVISSKEGVYALERAKSASIDALVFDRKTLGAQLFEQKIIEALDNNQIELIVFAGFLSILSENFTKRYANRIINVHPSLIPAFCGVGYYGLRVHKAALDYGVKVSGATTHLVNEVCDGGKILMQKAVYVEEGDTPETLQKRIMQQAEWDILPKSVELVASEILKAKRQ